VSAFATAGGVKLSSGAGTLTAGCGAPATEYCTFTLTLFASVTNGHASAAAKRVNVGIVTGKVQGGKSSELAIKLNAAGRELLRHGSMHLEAKGTVKNNAGLVAQFHKRITIKASKKKEFAALLQGLRELELRLADGSTLTVDPLEPPLVRAND
jgi:hypothetical protein